MRTINNLPIEILEKVLDNVNSDWHQVLMNVSRMWYHVTLGLRLRNNMERNRITPISVAFHSVPLLEWAEYPLYKDTNNSYYLYNSNYLASKGYLDVLKWIHDNNNMKFTLSINSAAQYAAREGQLEVLKWLREKDVEWEFDTTICRDAAKNGHFEVLKWAHENGCPWDKDVSMFASQSNQTEIVKWVISKGCPYDEWVGIFAATNGNVELLMWLRSKNIITSFSKLADHANKYSQWRASNFLNNNLNSGMGLFSPRSMRRLREN